MKHVNSSCLRRTVLEHTLHKHASEANLIPFDAHKDQEEV